MMGSAGLVLAGIIIFVLAIIALAVFCFVFWILMIIDCAKRNFKNDTEKIVWILVIVLAGFIGSLIYYFAVKYNSKKK